MMCINCWKAYGSHKIKNSKVEHLISAIENVLGYNLAGGNLHIVIDDWNIEDEYIQWCADNAIPQEENHEQRIAEEECAQLFLSCTLPERSSALYFAWLGLKGE